MSYRAGIDAGRHSVAFILFPANTQSSNPLLDFPLLQHRRVCPHPHGIYSRGQDQCLCHSDAHADPWLFPSQRSCARASACKAGAGWNCLNLALSVPKYSHRSPFLG